MKTEQALNGLRTYRPTFDNLTFQTPETQARIKAWLDGVGEGRVSRSLLLTGQPGLGKTTLSYALCKKLGVDPLDLYDQNCANERSIESVRALIERMEYLPRLGKYRAFILDEVQQLGKDAKQALLTPLEKLPPHVLFICCTSEPATLETAFESRFYRIHLAPYTDDQIAEILMGLPTPPLPRLIPEIVSRAYGNPRRAIDLAEGGEEALKGSDDASGQKAIQHFCEMLGSGQYDKLIVAVMTVKATETKDFCIEMQRILEAVAYKCASGFDSASLPTRYRGAVEAICKSGQGSLIAGILFREFLWNQDRSFDYLKALALHVPALLRDLKPQ